RVLHVELSARTAWLLWSDRRAAQPQLQLTRLTLPDQSGAPREPTAQTYRLGPTGVFLHAVQADGRLIVATRAGLRAYALQ
ncbi:unnamed protein product, partial [marine sediment metagenome]